MLWVLEQLITCGDAAFELHDKNAAASPPKATGPAAPLLTVRPTGNVSVRVSVPEVAAVPLLVTLTL